MLVTPTRAQMNDAFGPEEAEWRSAVAGALGKLFALLCAMTLSRTAAFASVAAAVALSTLAQLPAPPSLGPGESLSCAAGVSDSSVDYEREPVQKFKGFPEGFWRLWLLQFALWLSINTWSFYFTSVWAELVGEEPGSSRFQGAVHSATQLLLVNAVVFLGVGAVLPWLSGPAGICKDEETSLMCCLVLMIVSLLSLCGRCGNDDWLQKAVSSSLVVLGIPIAYQVLVNAPFAWLERQPSFDAARRGELTGVFNTSLAVAQAVTALLSGPIVAASGGLLWSAYAAAAIVGTAVLVGVSVTHHRTACPWDC
eukprot:TRINITY_DN64008_c0_g1_i1.p1 TRINITY_DN64008_c0_g1~~TRINITY_DN64008_c0_g1_i1.p1  ORF type:complete len:357 (-),score=60.15 TRINITY_DN64008_c0_g1_i1:103-1032(-)